MTEICIKLDQFNSIKSGEDIKYIDDAPELQDLNGTTNDKSTLQPLQLKFEDIEYSVTYYDIHSFSIKTKDVLKGVSGVFASNELSVILGASGCGKTSLLNILSGYRNEKFGYVSMNNEQIDKKVLRREVCYIMQDNLLQELLTVEESFLIAANLKLGNNVPKKTKIAKVESIIESLSLETCRKTLTLHLSGGQRKRLAIGLELLNDPSIIFLDEPTTGLDYSNAKQLISLLGSMAHKGQMIICTLHQPSALLLNMFDHLYVLTNEGHCTYQGSVDGLVPFLSKSGYQCPPHYNPADYVIEVTTEGGYIQEDCCNGKYFNSSINNNSSQNLERSNWTPITEKGTIKGPAFTKSLERSHYPINLMSQFLILLIRTLKKGFRDRFLTKVRLSMHLIIGSFLGIMYRGIGDDAARVHNNFSLLFFSTMFLMFTALSSMIITYPLEFEITRREHFNRWYSLKSYYLAVMVADIPVQVLCTVVYCVTVYFISKQPLEMWRFFMFLTICIFLTLYSQGMGVLVGTVLDVKNGVIFGPLTLLPWTIFSGYFLLKKDSPEEFKFLFKLSFLKYALEGIMLSVYGYDRSNLKCHETYCHYKSPSKFLDTLDMETGDYSACLLFLVISYILVKIASYFVLTFQIKRHYK